MICTLVVLFTLLSVPILAAAPNPILDKDQPRVSELLLNGLKVERNLKIGFDPLSLYGQEYPLVVNFESSSDLAFSINPRNDIQADLADLKAISTHASTLLLESPDPTEQVFQTWIMAQIAELSTEENAETPIEETPNAQSDEPNEAESDASAPQANLAQQSQNPIANLISVPLQNNTNFGVGQFERTSNILNIQPVVPTAINDDWVLINRFIIPLAYQPELAQIPLPNGDTESIGNVIGLGDIIYQGFFSPRNSGSFTWGVGPILSFPTATDEILGSEQWGAGPALVGLVTSGPIVTGALVSQLWSYAGDDARQDVSLMTIQPFFNYNFDQGWYVTTSPVITANWQSEPSEQWTVPIGGGFGRVFNLGRQPVNLSLSAYWNAVKPEGAADWTLRTQLTLLFP
jgi:hypothetical protein